MTDLTAVILTKDEEKNIAKCIRSVKGFAKRIVVVDSGSTDRTVSVARKLGAEVYVHPFEDYSHQFNWALDNTGITTKWTLRLDADERFTSALCRELSEKMKAHESDSVNGFVLDAWLIFMGKCLKHGGSRKKKLMVFKTGIGRIEDRKMDEHTLLSEGTSIEIKEKFIHCDVKDLSSYVKKLNWYAAREMQDYFEHRFPSKGLGDNKEISSLRDKKARYYKAPMFIRCWLYFFYAYFVQGNWRNGREGFIYSFLYHLYYRMLVDAKIYEQMKYKRKLGSIGDLK